ncbi:MAG: hypothetical protein AB7P23_07920 [Amphiplicatus sp.]
MAEGSLTEFGDRIDEKTAVWLKARPAPGREADLWRVDDLGNLIKYTDHGDAASAYGWVIHRKKAAWFDGADSTAHKIPLHCRANARLVG